MNKVFIESGFGFYYTDMWRRWGWQVTTDYTKADIIQFTGGEDVSPVLYDEVPHPLTRSSRKRDELCMGIYEYANNNGILMTGICRGGQFLNVMNGGKMFQHCDGHAIDGTHKATILESGLAVDVTSTHHQIMRPNRDTGIVLMEADKLGTFKEHAEHYVHDSWCIVNKPEEDDVEAIFYPDTNSLCYQPHPEWCDEDSTCVQAYKSFLRNYLEVAV